MLRFGFVLNCFNVSNVVGCSSQPRIVLWINSGSFLEVFWGVCIAQMVLFYWKGIVNQVPATRALAFRPKCKGCQSEAGKTRFQFLSKNVLFFSVFSVGWGCMPIAPFTTWTWKMSGHERGHRLFFWLQKARLFIYLFIFYPISFSGHLVWGLLLARPVGFRGHSKGWWWWGGDQRGRWIIQEENGGKVCMCRGRKGGVVCCLRRCWSCGAWSWIKL